MNEVEKRRGLIGDKVVSLKTKINQQYKPQKVVRRTILIVVEGTDFTADPTALIDLKVKLINDETLLAAKHGSWHGDTTRQEYEINFARNDLANTINLLAMLGRKKFILLSTIRTIWLQEGLQLTLDEYQGLGRALFEVETVGHAEEAKIDAAFKDFDLTPMTSEETISFVNDINNIESVQIDLDRTSAAEIARKMLQLHA